MEWLFPAVISVTSVTMVTLLVYVYLAAVEKERFLRIWSVAWSLYLLRHVVGLYLMLADVPQPLLLAVNQLAAMWSSLFLLWGTLIFAGKRLGPIWAASGGLLSLFTVIGVALDIPFTILTLPLFGLAAVAFIWTGVSLLRSQRFVGLGAKITGWTFIFWGIHKADYPFLRPVEWFAPIGFLMAAVLGLLVSLGTIVLYFEHRRRQVTEERALLVRIGDTSPVGIIYFTLDLVVKFMNPAARELLGLKQDYVGRRLDTMPIEPLDMADGGPRIPGPVNDENVTIGFSFRDEPYRAVLPNGTIRTFLVNVSTSYDASEQVEGHVVTFFDVTDREQKDQALDRLHRAHKTLSAANEAVLRAESEDELLNTVLSALLADGTYIDAWYGALAHGGLDIQFSSLGQRTDDSLEQQKSIATLAVRSGRPQIKQRTSQSQPGGRPALVAIPVKLDEVTGVLVLTAPAPTNFDDEELLLLERIGSNLALGMRGLRRRREIGRLVDALKDSEERFRTLFEEANVAIGVSRNGTIIRANRSCKTMFGVGESDTMAGKHLTHYIAPDHRERLGRRSQQREQGATVPSNYETVALRADGTTFPMAITGTVIALPEGPSSLVYLEDITERDKAAKATLAYEERLRALASELAVTEERERRGLASLLHDGVVQNLAAAKNRLTLLKETDGFGGDAGEDLAQSISLISETIDDTRSLTLQISPPILYHLGLEAAVDWLAGWLREQYALKVDVLPAQEEIELPDELASILYRSVRELLINTQKHAGVDRALVQFTRDETRIAIEVCDNGRGFEPAISGLAERTGFGLFSIQERLHHLGGSADIDSAPGKGTTVTLTLPLPDIGGPK